MSRVLIASGCFIGTSALYRCVHLREQFAALGVSADVRNWTAPQDIEIDRVQDYDLLVLHRVAMGDELARVLDRVRAAGRPVVFDTDDLVFEPQLTQWHRGVTRLADSVKTQYAQGVSRNLATLVASDTVTTATPFLSELARLRNKTTYTHRNALGHEMESLTHALYDDRQNRPRHDRVVIGYGSGTATHDVDFQAAVPALQKVLSRHPDVELWLAGDLKIGDALALFGDRIRRYPLRGWQDWLRLAAQFDVNLAPLEAGNVFCRAKSEIKFVEAGALGIPTVATRTDSFVDAITPDVDGYLASTHEEWVEALDELVTSAERRATVGEAARDTVMDKYSPSARTRDLGEILAQITGSTMAISDYTILDSSIAHSSILDGNVGARPSTAVALAEQPVGSESQLVETETMNAEQDVDVDHVTPLVINWLVSEPFRGSGGHTTLFRMVKHLVEFGHECHVYIPRVEEMTVHTASALREYVDTHFMVTGAIFHPWNGTVVDGDATIATQWPTVADLDPLHNGGRRYYFVQDFEPSFYAMGSEYVQAENTYRKGYHCITIGSWLAKILRERYHAQADHIDFAVDGEIYYPRATERPSAPRVAFYARPSTPRRAYKLGIAALSLVKSSQPEVEIALFGAHKLDPPPDFAHANLGVLNAHELATVYAGCDVGLVLSLTNPSLVPFEMMACRCPVVEMRSEQSQELLTHGETAFLADPTPEDLADGVLQLLHDDALRERIAQRGYEAVRDRTWRDSARQFEAILLQNAPPASERRFSLRDEEDLAPALLWQINRMHSSQAHNEQLIDELRDSLYRALAEKALMAGDLHEAAALKERGPRAPGWLLGSGDWIRGQVAQYTPVWVMGATLASPLTVGAQGLWQTFRADRSQLRRIELMFAPLQRRHSASLRLVVLEGTENQLLVDRTVSADEVIPGFPYAIGFPPRAASYQERYTVGVLPATSASVYGWSLWRYWWQRHTAAELRHGSRHRRGQLAFQAYYGERESVSTTGRSGPRGALALPRPLHVVLAEAISSGVQLAREAVRLAAMARDSMRMRGVEGLVEDAREYIRWRTSEP